MAILTTDANGFPDPVRAAVEQAVNGEEAVIVPDGQQATLPPVPPAAPKRPRVLGLHPGAMVAAPDFDDPLPDEFWLGDEA